MTVTRTWSDWSCTVRLTVDDPAVLDDACRDLRELMGRVDHAASRFRPDSELSKLNRNAGTLVPVSPLLARLVDVALVAAEETGGATDPTVGGAVIAAGYDADIETVRQRETRHIPHNAPPPARADNPSGREAGPAPVAVPPVRRTPGWRSVRRMQRFGLIGVPAGLSLDLGATAKAWTADRAATTIAGRYDCSVLVESGGDLRAAGRPDRPWLIEVAERAGDPAVLVSLRHGGLTTSTRTVRQWATSSGEAHHVIDPRTGLPSSGPWRSASVWAPSAVRANTFSTAVVATGEAAEARLRLAGHPARLVADDGEVSELAGWPASSRAA
jgi:thiamine biosynthesis lipoprotein